MEERSHRQPSVPICVAMAVLNLAVAAWFVFDTPGEFFQGFRRILVIALMLFLAGWWLARAKRSRR